MKDMSKTLGAGDTMAQSAEPVNSQLAPAGSTAREDRPTAPRLPAYVMHS